MKTPNRIYSEYYSRKHQLYLQGEVMEIRRSKVVFRPIGKPIGTMLVPVSMLNNIVMVNDEGLVATTILEKNN